MKFIKLEVIERVQIDTDRLGNPVYEDKITGASIGRFTEWNADDISINGREFTVSNRKCLAKVASNLVRDVKKIKVNQEAYTITGMKELGTRWVLLYLKKVRT